MSNTNPQGVLWSGYELLWYRIGRVLGRGAFGITYLAEDVNLERPVAVKEYFPSQYCIRDQDASVSPLSDEAALDFKWGMERFLAEARTLAQFEHPNIVRVLNVFEYNSTAYMVMQYEIGTSLSQMLKRRNTLAERDLARLTLPLLDGLGKVHAAGFIHRDIKPGNIYIRAGGSPVLLDFGSARQSMQEHTLTLTSLVSPGYAPIEQYTNKGERQGPWTDIYGFGATLYRTITGVVPPPAVERSEALSNDNPDPLFPAQDLISQPYSERLLAAIDHALAFRVPDRPQNISEWRSEIGFDETDIDTQPQGTPGPREAERAAAPREMPPGGEATTVRQTIRETVTAATEMPAGDDGEAPTVSVASGPARRWRMAGSAAALAVAVGLAIAMMGPGPDPDGPDHDSAAIEAPPGAEAIGAVDTLLEQVPSDPGQEEGRIAHLLAAARDDLSAQRLTTPAGNNAYEKFQAILAIDPQYEGALNGMEALLNRYLSLAQQAADAGDFDRAATLLKRAAIVAPDSSRLTRARVTLEQRRTEARMRALSDVLEQQQAVEETRPDAAGRGGNDPRRRLGGR